MPAECRECSGEVGVLGEEMFMVGLDSYRPWLGELQVGCIRTSMGYCGCSQLAKEEGNARCGREVVESAMG